MTYDVFIKERKKLITNSLILKEYTLEEEYPDVLRTFCGEEACQTTMYELINSNLEEEKKLYIPTFLLFAGVHGTETLGVNILMELIRSFQKAYLRKKEIYRILNNSRILIIPAINMKNYYESQDHDKYTLKGHDIEIDPWHNFNLGPSGPCFTSVSSKFLYKIFEDYLIIGAMAFTKGNFMINYPDLSNVTGTHETKPDEGMFVELANKMTNLFNFHKTDKTPELKIFNKPNDDHNDYRRPNQNKKIPGSFLEWAYGGSENVKSLSINCLVPNTHFASEYKHPVQNSNRAFVYEIRLDKSLIKGDFTKQMGNEIFIVDVKNKKSSHGVVAAGALVARQFLEFMRPFAILDQLNVEYESETPEDEMKVDLKFLLIGCPDYYKASLISPSVAELKENTQNLNIVETRKSTSNLTLTFNKKHSIPFQEKTDFFFKFDCYGNLIKILSKYGNPISHFVHLSFNGAHQVTKGQAIIKSNNLSKYYLEDFVPENVKNNLIFEIDSTKSILMENKPIFISLANYFPIKLTYDTKDGNLKYEVLNFNIPHQSKKIIDPLYSVETGIINHYVNFTDNVRSENFIQSLRNNDDIELIIYYNLRAYICDNLDVQKLKSKHDEITLLKNQLSENNTLINNLSRNNSKDVNKFRDEMLRLNSALDRNQKLTEDYKKKIFSDPCYHFNDLSENKKMRDLYFFNLSKNSNNHIISTGFVFLQGKYVKVISKPDVVEVKENANLLKETQKQITDLHSNHMNGTIVQRDYPITGSGDKSQHISMVPDFHTYSNLEPTKTMKMITDSIFCTSINPTFYVTDDKLKNFKKANNVVKNYTRDFNAILVKAAADESPNGSIFYYTSHKTNSNTLVLFNKKKRFVLKRTDKSIQLQGEYFKYRSDIKVYQGNFPMDDLRLSFVYVSIYDMVKKENLYDCFMNLHSINFNIRNLFILHKDLELETNRLVVMHEKTWIGVIVGIIVLLVIIMLGILIYYLEQEDKKKKEKKEKKELIEEVPKNDTSLHT
jgi:hypothetical protein